MASNTERLDEFTSDILRELGNIGTGNAVTSLTQMMNLPVEIEIPDVRLVRYQEFSSVLVQAEEVQTAVMVEVVGVLKGMFLFLMSETFTKTVLNAILGETPDTLSGLDDLQKSLLSELGNIMCGSYVRALSQLLELELDVSVPALCIDMGGAILNVPLTRFMRISDQIVMIENTFRIEKEYFKGRILFLPELESMEKLFGKLKEPLYG